MVQQEIAQVPRTRAEGFLKPTESGLMQMIRFGVVGGVTTAADMAILWSLTNIAHVWGRSLPC